MCLCAGLSPLKTLSDLFQQDGVWESLLVKTFPPPYTSTVLANEYVIGTVRRGEYSVNLFSLKENREKTVRFFYN